MTLPNLPNALPNRVRTDVRTALPTVPNLLPHGGPDTSLYYVKGAGGLQGPAPRPAKSSRRARPARSHRAATIPAPQCPLWAN